MGAFGTPTYSPDFTSQSSPPGGSDTNPYLGAGGYSAPYPGAGGGAAAPVSLNGMPQNTNPYFSGNPNNMIPGLMSDFSGVNLDPRNINRMTVNFPGIHMGNTLDQGFFSNPFGEGGRDNSFTLGNGSQDFNFFGGNLKRFGGDPMSTPFSQASLPYVDYMNQLGAFNQRFGDPSVNPAYAPFNQQMAQGINQNQSYSSLNNNAISAYNDLYNRYKATGAFGETK